MGVGKTFFFREERVCRNGNNENYCLQKGKFKIPSSRFSWKRVWEKPSFFVKKGFAVTGINRIIV